jgi:tetratricopeptide (TPR) repeat protein
VLLGSVFATLIVIAPCAGQQNVTAPGGVAVGGNLVGSTVNFGLTPEQLREVTRATVEGATEPLVAQIRAIGKTLDVTEDAAKTLLKVVGEDPNVSEDKLAEALTKVANDYKRLQSQATAAAALARDNPIAQSLVARAEAEINNGHLAQAREMLRQATQAQLAAAHEARNLREQAQAAEDAHMLGAASAKATEGDVALTERQYTEAADLFGQAARYVPSGHADIRLSYLDRQADALQRQGVERGDNQALRSAIEIYRQELQERTRDRVPLDWAITQNNLGVTLWRLGERESGTAHLEEAVAAYRAALEERTRDRVSLDWAMTQNNLGNALERLGEWESGTAHLEEAVGAYRAALEERTRERVPLDWAMTQNNLGNALWRLGERKSGTARLQQAVVAFDACLSVAETAWPEEWVQQVRSHREETRAEITWKRAAKSHGVQTH